MQDHLERYVTIHARLRRKGLLKPKGDFPAFAEELELLTSEFRKCGAADYAAFCTAASARCRDALSDKHGAAMLHMRAAQALAGVTDQEYSELGEINDDVLDEAMHCYLICIQIYTGLDRAALAAAVQKELGVWLLRFGRFVEAAVQFEHAAATQAKLSPSIATVLLKQSITCWARSCDIGRATECAIRAAELAKLHIERSTVRPALLLTLTLLYAAQRDFARALETANAIAHEPSESLCTRRSFSALSSTLAELVVAARDQHEPSRLRQHRVALAPFTDSLQADLAALVERSLCP